MPGALVVADDLTGATDTGHAFAAAGYRAAVVSWPAGAGAAGADADGNGDWGGDADVDVLVVDTDSRTDPPDRARETASDVTAAHPAGLVYKKVDSTLRGNVAAETAAVLETVGPGLAVVAPAFPANGRVTAGGYHLVDGDPVDTASGDAADADDDPDSRESPPATANLVDLFAETAHPVEHVAVDVVSRGVEAVRDRFRAIDGANDTAVVVCDALRADHLAAVADAGASVDPSLYVGSAGLAGHVSVPGDPPAGNEVLGVVGSTNARTVEQLSAVPAECVVDLDPGTALRSPGEAGRAAADRAVDAFAESDCVVVSSVGTPPETLYATAANLDLDRETARERVTTALRTAAETCWRERSPDALFLTGGTVAKHVLDALDVETVELTGRAVEAGIPVGRFQSGDGTPTPLVTKAGGFGGPDAIRECLDTLRLW